MPTEIYMSTIDTIILIPNLTFLITYASHTALANEESLIVTSQFMCPYGVFRKAHYPRYEFLGSSWSIRDAFKLILAILTLVTF